MAKISLLLLPSLALGYLSLMPVGCSIEASINDPKKNGTEEEPLDVAELCDNLAKASQICIPENVIAVEECTLAINEADDTCRAALLAAYSCIGRDVDPNDESTCTSILSCPVSEMKDVCDDGEGLGGAGGSGGAGGAGGAGN